ncbi:hypothetical protein HJFPF1_12219 [Paramyrothecium foliicola]|nr:hypothetical protein HJFPF1_12219 [Paramyrothecium foliicola]
MERVAAVEGWALYMASVEQLASVSEAYVAAVFLRFILIGSKHISKRDAEGRAGKALDMGL